MIALDLIKGALRRINAYQSGESIASWDEQDCLDTLNDLLDSYSNDHNAIVGSTENILQWVPGLSQYRIGNPLCTNLGFAPFTGTVTANSLTITGITNLPASLVIGATLSDTGGAITSGTTVASIGTTSITMSVAAVSSPAGLDSISYTVPGDFNIPRPLRITNGFTRFNSLDFTLDVLESQDRFTEILYKAQPGPWPTVAWYNPTMPYGIFNVYMTPGNAAPLHLYTDTFLGNLTLYQVFFMPQGYTRWIKWILARELCAEFGYPVTEAIKTNARDAEMKIKALNAQPAVVAKYERSLIRGNKGDGSWVFRGGYG